MYSLVIRYKLSVGLLMKYNNEQYFGLYLCTSDEKVSGERFKQKKYCVKQGDKIKISDTILQVKFHI